MSSKNNSKVSETNGLNKERIEATNRTIRHVSYITFGNLASPCVLVPPGGGATKENSLFWARELASMGPFFVVLYDIRDTGGSAKTNWTKVFAPFKTTPEEELKRLTGRAAQLSEFRKKSTPEPMKLELMEQLWDYDAYANDAISVLDDLKIQKAHVMGLSQGGMLSQIIAMQHPSRVLTCVSAASVYDGAGAELAMLSIGSEAFHDDVVAAKLYDKNGNLPWQHDTVTKEAYVAWKSKFLGILIPGFPKDLYVEIASKEFDCGIVTNEQTSICGLAWELWVRTGKLKRHHKQLSKNSVPVLYIHGRKDPVVHFGEVQRLFKVTKNSVLEVHEHGHNFGPPNEQRKILSKVTTFMKMYSSNKKAKTPLENTPKQIGEDTYSSNVTINIGEVSEFDIPKLYDTFLQTQTAADTHAVFGILLEKLKLEHLYGKGLALFVAFEAALNNSGLNFRQKKLLTDLRSAMGKAQNVVNQVKHNGKKPLEKVIEESISLFNADVDRMNKVLVCGAGPIGLRTACELQLLGFECLVVEKRPNFSRANILTFWDETMADMLQLGAKSYFPNLKPAGIDKHLGTRQIQVSLLKTLLILGGKSRYGTEVYGLRPPSKTTKRWSACFKKYIKHRRSEETAASLAVEFQKTKEPFGESGNVTQEINIVDDGFVNCEMSDQLTGTITFDTYVIAEGGWSDSTRKLGFSKHVQLYKSIFGLVINAEYNRDDIKEKNMRSQIHFSLSNKWPLSRCLIKAEFLEYLKGETHFLALVVPKSNQEADRTEKYIEDMKKAAEKSGKKSHIPESIIEMMRFSSTQKGLLEMGVLKADLGSGHLCLAPDNIDVQKLHEMARSIMSELGLPHDVTFCETNPVQLFDFSRRAKCIDPVRILTTDSASTVLSPDEYLSGTQSSCSNVALALPVGDALQEPNWTQGLGINRGFHTAMNQAFVCLVARERSVAAGVRESCAIHRSMLEMKWGSGNSGLAGSGSGSIGLKPFKEWDSDPRNRIRFK